MNPLQDPRFPIIALKGLPISVVSLLRQSELPVTQALLCVELDSTDKTMSRALHLLQEFRMCTHSEEGWSVTTNISMLGFILPEWLQGVDEPATPEGNSPVKKHRNFSDPSPACPSVRLLPGVPEVQEPLLPEADETEIFPECNETSTQKSLPAHRKPAQPVDNPVEKGRNFSDPTPLTTSSTSSLNLTNLKLEKNLLLGNHPNSHIEPQPDPDPTSADLFQASFQAAVDCGIWPEKARQLAKLPHVTPQFITEHIQAIGHDVKDIPLAIYRIERNRRVTRHPNPATSQNQAADDQQDRHKYLKGKYAKYIQH